MRASRAWKSACWPSNSYGKRRAMPLFVPITFWHRFILHLHAFLCDLRSCLALAGLEILGVLVGSMLLRCCHRVHFHIATVEYQITFFAHYPVMACFCSCKQFIMYCALNSIRALILRVGRYYCDFDASYEQFGMGTKDILVSDFECRKWSPF